MYSEEKNIFKYFKSGKVLTTIMWPPRAQNLIINYISEAFQKMLMLAKQEMDLDVLITPKRLKGGEPVTKNFFLIL